jgi:hypothetical protein
MVAYAVAHASGGADAIVTKQAPEESDEWSRWSESSESKDNGGRWGYGSNYR